MICTSCKKVGGTGPMYFCEKNPGVASLLPCVEAGQACFNSRAQDDGGAMTVGSLLMLWSLIASEDVPALKASVRARLYELGIEV